jgi:tRNA-uridine 2-sulfurtransferase
VAEKKDSTGICFIGERPFREFLQRYMPIQPGDMVTPEGKKMGRHQGLMYHTLGQRKGLGIGGVKGGEGGQDGEPWFVAGKNLARNELIVVQGHQHPLLLSKQLDAADMNWIGPAPETGKRYAAKTRYRQPDAACVVQSISDSLITLSFDQPQWAVTPGQSVVLYDGAACLGGGVIQASS